MLLVMLEIFAENVVKIPWEVLRLRVIDFQVIYDICLLKILKEKKSCFDN